ncbi:MAG: hypothetical protein DDT41_00540 [candidate division WS2 bacterium]|nr:hypothetical protein [Candidatus Psychracetigena formicireducens]
MELHWSIEQARLYQLWAVGLHGRVYEKGSAGIRACFRDLEGIQLDPLPVLGRNHDLVIQARVDGTHPGETLDLIHQERLGFEYWDKLLCVLPIEAFPTFRAFMSRGGPWGRGGEERLNREYPVAVEEVYYAVERHGAQSSRDLKALHIAQGDYRGWKSTKAANVALKVLWNQGRLSVSYRRNYQHYFDLTERVIPAGFYEGDPPSLDTFMEYLLQKRVRMVGLLPSRGDANAWELLHGERANDLPARLIATGRLALVQVEGIKTLFYASPQAAEGLASAEKTTLDYKARFIAPLDTLLWARAALERLWDFQYAWEVYKPASKRRYGYYVLPILYGNRFVARFDGRYDRAEKTLHVLAYYEEPGGLPLSHSAIHAGFQRFLIYLNGQRIVLPTGEVWERGKEITEET